MNKDNQLVNALLVDAVQRSISMLGIEKTQEVIETIPNAILRGCLRQTYLKIIENRLDKSV
jgi:hypothetical protein